MKIQQNIGSIAMTELDLSESPNRAFDTIVLETIDEVFSCLGNSCKKAIYHYIETECAIPRNAIPNHANELSNALQNLFGPGAGLIEIEIMKRLSRRVPEFKFSPRRSSLSLEMYLVSLSSFL
jgi:hypothetical protein